MIRSILIFLVSISTLSAQEGLPLLQEIPLKSVDGFSIDQFDNVYIIRDSELLKYNDKAEQLASFSDPILGDIYQVEVRNAMSPYIFYRDVNQMVVVDNRLNSKSTFNFSDFGFIDVKFVSFSDQNNVWLYEQSTDKLYRVNPQKQIATNKSVAITPIIGGENEPIGLLSTLNQVYLNVPSKGLFVFDAVGSFEEVIPIKNIASFDIYKNLVYALVDGSVVLYNLNTGTKATLMKVDENTTSLKVSSNRIYLLSAKSLKIYSRK